MISSSAIFPGANWQKVICMMLAVTLLPAPGGVAETAAGNGGPEDEQLPLPRWSPEELRAFREQLPNAQTTGVLPTEGGVAIMDMTELMRGPALGGMLDPLKPDENGGISPRLRPEDMRLFLPDSILGHPVHEQAMPPHRPTPPIALKEVTGEFLSACAQTPPEEYLIDPDLLVPEMQSHSIRSFLEFHARDARIKLHVMILARDSQLPGGAQLEKTASGSLLKTETCLLVYPLGEPWRARLFVSQSVSERASNAFLVETVQACLEEASQTSDMHDQLHRYLVHLSTRLFWLQKALGPKPEASKAGDLEEVALDSAPASNRYDELRQVAFVLGTGITAIIVGMILLGLRHWRHQFKRRQQNFVWILPELETIPRLGGAFTGGGGGTLQY